jgi:hypothetical protein
VSRREDISIEEFRRFWKDERYAALFKEYNKVYKTTGMKKNLVLKVPMNALILERQGTRKPYDGVIELWWDSARELVAVNETPEADDMRRRIGEYEEQFIDKTRSTIFFTEYPE